MSSEILKLVILSLDCEDTLTIDTPKIRLENGRLFQEDRLITENCEEAIKYLLESKYTNRWYSTLWSLKEKETEHNYSPVSRTEKMAQNILKNKEYDSLIEHRLKSLGKKVRDSLLTTILSSVIPFVIIGMAIVREEDTISGILFSRKEYEIKNGLLYKYDETEAKFLQVTHSMEDTLLSKVPDTIFIGDDELSRVSAYYEKARIWFEKDSGYRSLVLERLKKFPKTFRLAILNFLNPERDPIQRRKEAPSSVREFYAKDCSDEDLIQDCVCVPSQKYIKECSFSNSPLITNVEEKIALFSNFFPETKFDTEAIAYIEEYPVFVLKKGTVLCHSMHRRRILSATYGDDENTIFRHSSSLGWWNKYFVGQSNYGGGWFTYETNYGGPNFGMLLYYQVSEDIPILFVPNYKVHKDSPEYFPDKDYPWYHTHGKDYTGSHLVQGPKNWKEKGFRPVISEYFGDQLGQKLVELGFPGYISCDECEVFITHKAMKIGLFERPFRIRYETADDEPDFKTVFDLIVEALCPGPDLSCPLEIKEGVRNDQSIDISIPKQIIEDIMPFDRFTTRFDTEVWN